MVAAETRRARLDVVEVGDTAVVLIERLVVAERAGRGAGRVRARHPVGPHLIQRRKIAQLDEALEHPGGVAAQMDYLHAGERVGHHVEERLDEHVVGLGVDPRPGTLGEQPGDAVELDAALGVRLRQRGGVHPMQGRAVHGRLRLVKSGDVLGGGQQLGEVVRAAAAGVDAKRDSASSGVAARAGLCQKLGPLARPVEVGVLDGVEHLGEPGVVERPPGRHQRQPMLPRPALQRPHRAGKVVAARRQPGPAAGAVRLQVLERALQPAVVDGAAPR